ncbi:hypothetical protein WN51_01491 [Melipona quadrifasciata]|uniref:Uncharacterized protein n=1 Tax=Melipona quadrifasciata TaxID=166423 RepID=A0A0N0BEU4_9HYME|nr:hypothetical protein WN51_01491 [Melipona quadrifasciata]
MGKTRDQSIREMRKNATKSSALDEAEIPKVVTKNYDKNMEKQRGAFRSVKRLNLSNKKSNSNSSGFSINLEEDLKNTTMGKRSRDRYEAHRTKDKGKTTSVLQRRAQCALGSFDPRPDSRSSPARSSIL